MNETDNETVSGVLLGDEDSLRHFFFEECTPIFYYITDKIFQNRLNKNALINEFYIYLQENNWYKLRQFNHECELKTWISVIAIRFFLKKKDALIRTDSTQHLLTDDITEHHDIYSQDAINLLKELKNKRYRYVIHTLVLEDRDPKEVADEMGITTNNLRQIKGRALQELKKIIEKETGYL